jgi:hypothetical protein
MLVVRSDRVLARLDPSHGGEILELVDLVTGRQLLARPPFASFAPRAGDLDEETWTQSYRGGWQCVTPNAGNRCDVDGALHGFHGRASNDPWSVLDTEPSSASLRWSGHGLEVTRTITAAPDELSVHTSWRGVNDAPLVALEHVALGLELIDPEVRIRLPAGRAYELSEREGPTRPPDDAPVWPDVRLLDGGTERIERWPLSERRSRLFAVADLPEGWAEVVNCQTGQGIRLEWEARALPHLWIWHEVRTTGGPWRELTEVLCVEPSTVPHSLGLATAIREGQAMRLRAGERIESTITAQPFEEHQ